MRCESSTTRSGTPRPAASAAAASAIAIVVFCFSLDAGADAPSADAGSETSEPTALAPAPDGASSPTRGPIPPPPPGSEARRPLELEDYLRKNEGGYFTGLPLANYDSNTGFGFGARVYYYFNGRVTDPLFAYTPYRQRVFLQGFATTKGLQFHWLDYDVPNVGNGPFRFRAQLLFVRNSDQHYFGIGHRSMGPLQYPGSSRAFTNFSDYAAARDSVDASGQTYSKYDSYDMVRPIGILGVERAFLQGMVRLMAGLGFSYNKLHDYTGDRVEAVASDGSNVQAPMARTRLAEDCGAGLIVGCRGGWDNFLRFGAAFDTRDYEPDPNHGVFVDAALDIGTAALGSRYTWVRALLSPKVYVDLLPRYTDLVLALRGTLQIQSQSTPFFGMELIPYTEDPRNGLGGLRTLRGFQQDRFVGPVMTLVNAELRWTFVHFDLWRQKLALIGVPFVDIGAVFDRVKDVSLADWRRGQGLALRMSWNLATVVTAEYAVSNEDTGLYINFNHMF